jgi:hypothetical protein
MARKGLSVLPNAIAVLAISLGALTITTWSGLADAAAACNPAPKASAPQGSHWYYHLDRTSQRKCWYLAEEGRRTKMAAPRAASLTRNALPSSPAMNSSDEQAPPPAELKPAEKLLDSPAIQAGPMKPDAPSDEQASSSLTSAAQEPSRAQAQQADATVEVQKSTAIDPPPAQPFVLQASVANQPTDVSMGTIKSGLLVFAASFILASLILYAAVAAGARKQVRIVDLNKKLHLRRPTTPVGAIKSQRLAEQDRDDSIDEERLRQFELGWRRQAA